MPKANMTAHMIDASTSSQGKDYSRLQLVAAMKTVHGAPVVSCRIERAADPARMKALLDGLYDFIKGEPMILPTFEGIVITGNVRP